MKRSQKKRITVGRDDYGMDFASQNAYFQAIHQFGADDCGHFGKKYREDFPRSESRMVVEFIKLKTYGGMGGQTHLYTFEAWLEQIDDEEDWEDNTSLKVLDY